MLMLLAAAQVHRTVVPIFNMQPDGVFIELTAGIQIDHVEHDMAASDDVERRIEDMLRDRHGVSLTRFRQPGMVRRTSSGVPRLRARAKTVIGRRTAPAARRVAG